MRRTMLAALATAAVMLAAAGCNAQPPAAGDDAQFGARVRDYLLAHPEVIAQALSRLQSQQDEAQAALSAAAIATHRQALEHDPRDGVLGNPNGRVTVVEFFDYRCPYCKAAEPEVERLLAHDPNVRLVLKAFPILDVEDQSHISEDAARAALGAIPQGRYGKVHRALLAERQLDEAGIARVLAASGVDAARDRAVGQAPETTTHIAETKTLAHQIGIDGTPAFIVGDQMIAGAQMDVLEAAVRAAEKKR